jgi:hypothetical protein
MQTKPEQPTLERGDAGGRLAPFRARLRGLRRRRQRLRWLTAYSALAAGVLATLLVLLLADWALDMSRPQRLVALAVGVGGVVWVGRRFTLPLLRQRESELDMALLIERQEHIDTDLVAALQFESPDARRWGSSQLEQAVVDRVAEGHGRIDVYAGLERGQARKRSALAVALACVWLMLACLLPQHLGAFLDRLLLGIRHYPSNTRIEALRVNEVDIDPTDPARTPVTVAYGAAVEFQIRCAGILPREGEARLEAAGGQRTVVALGAQAGRRGQYAGQLSSLTEAAEYRVVMGDARTEAGRVLIVPLPTADVELEVVPPSYATSATAGRMPKGLRHISVIEGSRVIVRLKAGKPLRQATLAIEDQRFALRRDAPGTDRSEGWIQDATDSPLAAVLAPLKFEIQVSDRDGLPLEQPLQCAVQISPDQAPRVGLASLTPAILPTARPSVIYRATDDYGLKRLWLVRQVTHPDGTTAGDEVEIYHPPDEKHLSRSLGDRQTMDLSTLKLTKGDKLKVSLRAEDFRGPRAGQQTLSEPVTFQVTDEQGILTLMMEWDRKSAEQLQEMIQRQLGLGGTP